MSELKCVQVDDIAVYLVPANDVVKDLVDAIKKAEAEGYTDITVGAYDDSIYIYGYRTCQEKDVEIALLKSLANKYPETLKELDK